MEYQDFQRDHSLTEDEPLTLPHFDEEATLQSARPVVPLHEVRKASRVRQRWLLGSALFLAAVLGAVTASLIYNSRGQSIQDPTTAANEAVPAQSPDFVAPAGEASGATLNPDEAVALESGAITATKVEKTPADVRQPPPIKNTAHREQIDKLVPQPQVEDRQREDLLMEQQWRRQRREARHLRRQRRVEGRQPKDDLTRIREIFEGSPRP
jgi:hypothetical protein